MVFKERPYYSFYVYTSSEQVYGDQLNNESTAQVGSVNLYLVSSNAPFQVKW